MAHVSDNRKVPVKHAERDAGCHRKYLLHGLNIDSIDNQFKAWVRNARATNADLRIAIKADANTPYSVIKNVMNSLQDLRENRYNLITSLKTTSED